MNKLVILLTTIASIGLFADDFEPIKTQLKGVYFIEHRISHQLIFAEDNESTGNAIEVAEDITRCNLGALNSRVQYNDGQKPLTNASISTFLLQQQKYVEKTLIISTKGSRAYSGGILFELNSGEIIAYDCKYI